MTLEELKKQLEDGKLTQEQFDEMARILGLEPEPNPDPESQTEPDDIEERIQKAIDRATNKLGNENKALREKLEKLKKTKLSAEEIAEEERREKETALAEREAAVRAAENRMFALKQIKKIGLDSGDETAIQIVDLVMQLSVSFVSLAAGVVLLPMLFLGLTVPIVALAGEVPGLANAFQILAMSSVAAAGALLTITTGLTTVCIGFNTLNTTVTAACQKLVMSLTACGNKIASVCVRIVSQSRNCASGIKSAFNSVKLNSTGANIMSGLLNGMRSRSSAVLAQARAIAQSISSTMNSTLDIHSPSRVTTKTGVRADQGLIVGMEKTAPQVEATARRVASSAGTSMDAELRAYSPENTKTARTFYGGDTTIAPVFQLDIHGAVSENDRTTERAVKRWVLEALEAAEESMYRKQRTAQVL